MVAVHAAWWVSRSGLGRARAAVATTSGPTYRRNRRAARVPRTKRREAPSRRCAHLRQTSRGRGSENRAAGGQKEPSYAAAWSSSRPLASSHAAEVSQGAHPHRLRPRLHAGIGYTLHGPLPARRTACSARCRHHDHHSLRLRQPVSQQGRTIRTLSCRYSVACWYYYGSAPCAWRGSGALSRCGPCLSGDPNGRRVSVYLGPAVPDGP